MQAAVTTNGTMSFYCKIESGNSGSVRIWVTEDSQAAYDAKTPDGKSSNSYTNEVYIAEGADWTRVPFNVEQNSDISYVNIANRTRGEKLCIDMMTWTPGGSPAVIADLTVGVGGFSFAFMPDPRFAYKLHGTNELTVVRTLWPVLLSTNGSEKISFTLPIEATEPKMFYYLETIAK